MARRENTAVLTAPVPTFDGDITHHEAARAVEDLVRERYEEVGRLLVRFGNPPKFAIPFRTDKPFEKLSVKLKARDGTEHKIEFLCKGQLVVVDGIHPDTHRPYSWHGGTLVETPWEELPSITKAEAHQLVDDAVDLLVRDFGFTRVRGLNPKGKTRATAWTKASTNQATITGPHLKRYPQRSPSFLTTSDGTTGTASAWRCGARQTGWRKATPPSIRGRRSSNGTTPPSPVSGG